MPTRSLRSSLLRWPDSAKVDAAARAWATAQSERNPEIQQIGYFGSYARGDWGVGSDLDLVVIVDAATQSFERRGLAYETTSLPVPADLVVYVDAEWEQVRRRPGFGQAVAAEAVWVYESSGSGP